MSFLITSLWSVKFEKNIVFDDRRNIELRLFTIPLQTISKRNVKYSINQNVKFAYSTINIKGLRTLKIALAVKSRVLHNI